MVGSRLIDPLGLEGEKPGTDEGLGLLPHVTTYAGEKVVKRTSVRDAAGSGAEGFEIHKGLINWEVDWRAGGGPLFVDEAGKPEGYADQTGKIYATLVHHAVFYDPALRRAILEDLAKKKGVSDEGSGSPRNPVDEVMRAVARAEELLRKSVDLDELIKIAGEAS